MTLPLILLISILVLYPAFYSVHLATLNKSMAKFDLAGIQAPVLLIHGRYDRMVAFEVSIAILNHIENSRLVLLNNCGHWAPFEKPVEWTAHLLAFLQRY